MCSILGASLFRSREVTSILLTMEQNASVVANLASEWIVCLLLTSVPGVILCVHPIKSAALGEPSVTENPLVFLAVLMARLLQSQQQGWSRVWSRFRTGDKGSLAMKRVKTNWMVLIAVVALTGCGKLAPSVDTHKRFSREDPSFLQCEPDFARFGDLYAYAGSSEVGDSVVASWTDSITDSTMWLEIEIYHKFGEGISAPGTYQFTEQEASYHTCSLCVVAWSERWTEDGWVQKAYMPVPNSGLAEINELTVLNDPQQGSNPIGSLFSGSLDVVMQEVVIDPNTWLTTPVESGCSGRLTFRWSDTVQETQETTCTTEPVADSMQECSACFGEGGYSESFSGDWQDGGGFIVYNSWVNSRIYPTQWLNIESYSALGGPQQPGTYEFTDQDATYANCALCVVAYVEVETDDGLEEKTFMPVEKNSGQALIASIDTSPNPSGNFAGQLDVMMQEVFIDYETWETKPVAGGCSGLLRFVWDTPVACFFCEDPEQENCSNNIDDDGDALVDCKDDDCENAEVCQITEEHCSNNIDDDGDSLIDCEDGDCADNAACQIVPENCDNKIDDDGDGQVDCSDSDCKNSSKCGDKGCGVGGTQPWSGLIWMLLGFLLLRRRQQSESVHS